MTGCVPTYPVLWPRFRLSEPTGAMELAVAEALATPARRPERVSRVLGAMLAELEGTAVLPSRIAQLSAATREWLLQHCAASCRPAQDWFDVECPACGGAQDIALDLAALPRAPGQDFPQVTLPTPQGDVTLQAPNGADEDALAAGLSHRAFLARLVVAGQAAFDALSDADLARLDARLDAALPDCADQTQITCADCGQGFSAQIDPLHQLFPGDGPVVSDVHALSWAYKWSEAEVLAMPSARRARYVSLIKREKGV